MKLNYLLLDVFTTERLKGNPLAVVLNADPLLDDQMQAIAREFNLSETVFIMRPQAVRHTAAVRIFTPSIELPFAGHPTVGAAVVLGTRRVKRRPPRGANWTGHLRHGENGQGGGFARFALPQLPTEVGPARTLAESRRRLARTRGHRLRDVYAGGLFRWRPHYLVRFERCRARESASSGGLERRIWARTARFTPSPKRPRSETTNWRHACLRPAWDRRDPAPVRRRRAYRAVGKHSNDGQTELTLRQGKKWAGRAASSSNTVRTATCSRMVVSAGTR